MKFPPNYFQSDRQSVHRSRSILSNQRVHIAIFIVPDIDPLRTDGFYAIENVDATYDEESYESCSHRNFAMHLNPNMGQ